MFPDELTARSRRVPQELLTQGDLAVAAELFAVECRHRAPWPLPPGIDGARQLVATLRRAFPDLRAMVDGEIADGSIVVQRLSLGGRHDGPYLGSPASGRRVTWPAVAVFRWSAQDAITEHWVIWDQIGLSLQLDARRSRPLDAPSAGPESRKENLS